MTMKQMLMGATAVAMLGLAAVPALAKGGFGGPFGGMPEFAALDTDKDGKITPAEIATAHEAMTASLDADKDGFVTAEEIVATRMAKMPADAPAQVNERMTQKVAKMLTRKDGDGDGKVSLAELKAAENPARIEKMIGMIDQDGDGAISQAEFDAVKARMAERGKAGRDHRHGHGHGHGFGPGQGMMPGGIVPGDLPPPPAVGVQPFPVPMQ